MEVESVHYVHMCFMEKGINFETEEELERWNAFVMQMNNTTFKRGRWLIASNYCGGIITIKFSGIEEPLRMVYGGLDISMDDFIWIPSEELTLPFSEEEFSFMAELNQE